MLSPRHAAINLPLVTKVTRYKAQNAGDVVKRFSLVKGKIQKEGAPMLLNGSQVTETVIGFDALETLLASIGPDECISLGTFPAPASKVLSKGRYEKRERAGSDMSLSYTRSRANMAFREALALMCFDMDTAQTLADAVAAFRMMLPVFAEGGAEFLVVRSSSGRVSLAGEAAPKVAKWHFYFFAESTLMVKDGKLTDFGRRMVYRAWLLGYGERKVSENGAYLSRASTVDGDVFQPERIFYEGAPVVHPGVVLHPNNAERFNRGNGGYLVEADAQMSDADIKTARAMVQKDRRDAVPACQTARAAFLKARGKERAEAAKKAQKAGRPLPDKTPEAFARDIENALENKVLSLDYVLDSQAYGKITFGEAIEKIRETGEKLNIKPVLKPSSFSYNAYVQLSDIDGSPEVRDHSTGTGPETTYFQLAVDADTVDALDPRDFFRSHQTVSSIEQYVKRTPMDTNTHVQSVSELLGLKWTKSCSRLFWVNAAVAYAMMQVSSKDALAPDFAGIRSAASGAPAVLSALSLFETDFTAHKEDLLAYLRLPERECNMLDAFTLDGKDRVFVDHSTTGSGKSEFYIPAMRDLAAANGWKFVVITPYRALSSDVAGRFDLPNYQDGVSAAASSVVTCLPSFDKAAAGEFRKTDCVYVLDEFDAQLDMLSHKGLMRADKLAEFAEMMRTAKMVALLSSTISRADMDEMEDLAGMARGTLKAYVKRPVTPPHANKTLHFAVDRGTSRIEQAKLKQQEKVWMSQGVIPCAYYASKALCDRQSDDMTKNDGVRSLTVTTDGSESKALLMKSKDWDAVAAGFDRIAYTNAMAIGVSYRNPKMSVVAMHLNAFGDAAMYRQASNRARAAREIHIAGKANTHNILAQNVHSVESVIAAFQEAKDRAPTAFEAFQIRREHAKAMRNLDAQRVLCWRLMEEGISLAKDDRMPKQWEKRLCMVRSYSKSEVPDSATGAAGTAGKRLESLARAQITDLLGKRRNAALKTPDIRAAIEQGWTPPRDLLPKTALPTLPDLEDEIIADDRMHNEMMSARQTAKKLTAEEHLDAERVDEAGDEPPCGRAALYAARIRLSLHLDYDAPLTDTHLAVFQSGATRSVAARQALNYDAFAGVTVDSDTRLGRIREAVVAVWGRLSETDGAPAKIQSAMDGLTGKITAAMNGSLEGEVEFNSDSLHAVAYAMFRERTKLVGVDEVMPVTWVKAKDWRVVKDKLKVAVKFLRLLGIEGALNVKKEVFTACEASWLLSAWRVIGRGGGTREERILSTGHAVTWGDVCLEVQRIASIVPTGNMLLRH